MKTYKLIAEDKFKIADAYWISPIGKIISISMTHINAIFSSPKTYGYTQQEIRDLYKKYNEKIGQEGKARERILIDLVKRGWIRIRNYSRKGHWAMNIGRLNKKTKDYVQNFAKLLLKNNEDKYDIITIETFAETKVIQ